MDISCHARSFKQGLILFMPVLPILERNALGTMYIYRSSASHGIIKSRPPVAGKIQNRHQNSSLYVLQCSLVPAIDKICISIQKAKTKQNFSVSVYLFIHLFIHHHSDQKQFHSAKTHHLALRSASTKPLHVPLSPILMIVSHTPPFADSSILTILSLLRINLRILPLGAWIASFAGFCCFCSCWEVLLALEPAWEK